ncbi:MAG: hypothetical protein ACE5KO_00985 [Candidatus Bathyarchaeia archaeon]
MKIITKDGFKLPFMGKDKFIELMKMGIGYNRQNGTFFISDMQRLDQIKATLTGILNEELGFAQTCAICFKTFSCSECKFFERCETRDIPLYCLCPDCFQKDDVYTAYMTSQVNPNRKK